jgi:predicted SAM-dependent methyltransferase
VKINLGSGIKRYEGYLNVDSDPSVNPDFLVDLEKDPLPFEDNSITDVKAYHIFEHIGPNFFNFLKELYRVCKNNAIIDVHVPHHRHDYFVGDPSHVRPITIEMMNRFSKKYNDTEKTDTGSTQFAYVLDIDFEIFHTEYHLEPYWKEQFANMNEEQVNMTARIYNNVIQEIHFKMVVRKNGT